MTDAFNHRQTWQLGNVELSTDRTRLDLPFICNWLSEDSYWAKGRPHAVIRTTIAHSVVFGMYSNGQQIGFARLVTDAGVFGYIADVFVLPDFQGAGLGKWLVDCILQHPALATVSQLYLLTGDAHGLYAQYGFRPLNAAEIERWMRCESVMEQA